MLTPCWQILVLRNKTGAVTDLVLASIRDQTARLLVESEWLDNRRFESREEAAAYRDAWRARHG